MKHGWEYKKLGDCFPYIKNGANIKQIKDADGLPITRIETLSGGVFNRDRMGYAGIYNLDKYSEYVLEDGDLLLSHINSKTYIGRTVEYRAENGETIIHGMNLLRLKSNSDVINSSFFAYYTLSHDFKTNVAKVRKDAVNQSSIAISDIRKFSIPVPPIQSQQYVVDELDKINELIRLKKEQLSDYDKLAQSLFYEIFGDPIENEKGWEVKKLREVCIYPNKRIALSDITSHEYVGVETLVKNKGGVLFSEELPNAENAIEYIENDILIGNIRPYLKKIWKSDRHGGASGDVVVIRISDSMKEFLNPVYLFKLLATDEFFEYDNANTHGAKMPRGDRKAIGEFTIQIPPTHLQHTFAQRIELIEQQKAEIKSTIADLETILASRMQYWFD